MTSAREYTARLADLLSRERSAMADFLVALADFDRSRGWLELGYPSLFHFLHRELGLSKGAAHYRKVGAGLVQKFPEIVAPLRDGRLCVTSLVEVAKVLTPENAREVLPRFFHASRRDAMAVAAEIRPAEAPPHRVVVTAVRAPPMKEPGGRDGAEVPAPAIPPAPPSTTAAAVQPAELDGTKFQVASPPLPAPARRDSVEPLTAERSRLHVTVSRRFLAKLEKARDALSHSHPGASEEEILEAGLDLLLARDAKRKGLVEKPRKEARPSSPDHIPASVKRAVWTRDRGCCQWPLDSGGICGSTVRLQLDHIVPRARGGPSTVENLRVTCAVHNALAARRVFGDEWMDRYGRGVRQHHRSSCFTR